MPPLPTFVYGALARIAGLGRIISASMPESARKVAFSPLLPSATPAENQAGELRDTSQCLRRGLRPIGRNRRINLVIR
jgi:hypothetical protein